jgi:predicted nucleotidyltransferase
MYSELDFAKVRDIVLNDVPSAVGIILFGSYARGIAQASSDIDIMILVEKDLEWRTRREVLNRIYRDTAEKGYLVDFLLKTKARFEEDKLLPTLSRTVSEDGKILWMKK